MKAMIWKTAGVWPAAAAVLVGGSAFRSDAAAQSSMSMELGNQSLALTQDEMRALSDVGNLARSGQIASQNRALAEARRVVNGRDARHVLALYELEIAGRRGDQAMRAQALDTLIASPLTAPGKLPSYLQVRGQIAYKAAEYDAAKRFWTRLAAMTPSDALVLFNLAQVEAARQNDTLAADMMTRAIATRVASGQTTPEDWYRQRLSIAQRGKLTDRGIDAARALVSAYPTAANWRDALIVYRQLTLPEGTFEIHLLRFMRRIDSLTQADEYQRMAQLLNLTGASEEAKAVLMDGINRSVLDPASSPTREIIAEVDRAIAMPRRTHAGAAEPLTKAAEQVRRGMAHVSAGNRSEADAAFRSAAAEPGGGRYADLASFWLTWLARERP